MTDERCAVCGHDADDHDAGEFGGGCGVCGDCPGYRHPAAELVGADDVQEFGGGPVQQLDFARQARVHLAAVEHAAELDAVRNAALLAGICVGIILARWLAELAELKSHRGGVRA